MLHNCVRCRLLHNYLLLEIPQQVLDAQFIKIFILFYSLIEASFLHVDIRALFCLKQICRNVNYTYFS